MNHLWPIVIDIYPTGESGIALESWTASGLVELPPDGYFEGGGAYSATVTITENLGVKVDTNLRSP